MIKIYCNAGRAVDLKNELLTAGLCMNQDFVWAWHPPEYDGFTQPDKPHHATFEFTDPKLESFYRIKWA